MNQFRLNQQVETPNGVGNLEGNMYADGLHYILVRHFIKNMTDKAAGTCFTPRAVISGLWCYTEEEVEIVKKAEAL